MASSLQAMRRGFASIAKSNMGCMQSKIAVRNQTRVFSSVTNPADAVLSGANAAYVDQMYQKWKSDPSAVHASWAAYFSTGAFVAPPTFTGSFIAGTNVGASASSTGSADATVSRVVDLIRAYQQNGHKLASLDPLSISSYRNKTIELNPEYYGLTDLSKAYDVKTLGDVATLFGTSGTVTLGEIINRLKTVYSSTIGYEVSHVATADELSWLRSKIETDNAVVSKDKKKRILQRLAWATHFEQFLKSKFNVKRFGLEGGESAIVSLREIVKASSDLGVESVVMGMPHRGRLNILTNIVKKPLEILFSEFAGNSDAKIAQKRVDGAFGVSYDEFNSAGDVKYHHGWSSVNELDNGKKMHVTMLANPSHLEAVNPLVQGKTRSKQFFAGDDGSKVMSIILHGDAAFSGQGVVFESLAMHGLPDYTVGGTIHVVINNQIGFTTDPYNSRSGPYCTDVAKAFQAPIFHVNGDDPEAVARVSALAAEYRAKFKKDVVLDIVCYRLHGHNELDQPSFTQPLMYKAITAAPTTLTKYQQQLVKEGSISQEDVDAINAKVNQAMRDKFDISRTWTAKPNDGQFLTKQWSTISGPLDALKVEATGLPIDTLKNLGTQIATIPQGFELHRSIGTAYKDKAKSVEAGAGLDWATAEGLAFASLLSEGFPIRLSGQDAERGTFSHRHAVVHNQATGEKYTPLLNLKGDKAAARFNVVNSLLSEYAALGFDLGYSMEHPDQLVLWEGQFGDFVNGAQIIIDNFLSSGEYKWNRQTGLVMLLPHGFEGQGAEHSSARMERFLQSCNDDPAFFPRDAKLEEARQHRANWQIVNMTSASNYFHVLRRQLKRSIRKPLIVFSPKSLLRHKGAAGTYEEMAEGTAFRPVIGDAHVKAADVKRHIVCSGKVYFDLVDHLEKTGLRSKVAITRVEQISPFPFAEVEAEDKKYGKADLVFVQEEHMNMGPWQYVGPRLETAVKAHRPDYRAQYIGRPPAAAAATGSGSVHSQELANFLNEVSTF